MLDGYFRTLLREFARTYENRTPIRLALDGRSPPSYGNGGKRLENATLILLDVGRASLAPLRSLRFWSKMTTLRSKVLDALRAPPSGTSRDVFFRPPPYVKYRTGTSHPPTEMDENVLRTRPSYCWTLDGLR